MTTSATTQTTDHSIVLSADVPASAEAVFALLADPARHPALDGSGMVRGALDPTTLTEVGQIFVMQMHRHDLGDYQTANTVTDVVPGRRIAWTTARVGNPPAGVRWQWDVEPAGENTSHVKHTYDWSGVNDPAILARVSFPRVSAEQLRGTLDRLVAALTSG